MRASPGIGETYGGARTVEALRIAEPFVLGLDPLETGILQHRLGVFCIGYEMSVPPLVRAGIEMACLDAAGKALGRSVATLLGGAVRDRVQVASYLFYRYPSADGRRRRSIPRNASSSGPSSSTSATAIGSTSSRAVSCRRCRSTRP